MERAQREQPASVILSQTGWKENPTLRNICQQGFQEIALAKQAHTYFETDQHIGCKRFKRMKDVQADL